MKKLIFCIFFHLLLFCSFTHGAAKSSGDIVTNSGEYLTCKSPLSSFDFTYFSLAYIVSQHKGNSLELLEKWTLYLFEHCGSMRQFKALLDIININKFDGEELDCFKRAVTLYLLFYYSADLKKQTELKHVKMEMYKELTNMQPVLTGDFISLLNDPSYFKLAKAARNVHVTEQFIDSMPEIDLAKRCRVSSDDLFASDLRNIVTSTFYNNGFYSMKESIGKQYTDAELVIIFDINWLINASSLSFVGPADVSYVNFEKIESSKKTKLGIKKRSKKFDISPLPEQHADMSYFNENDSFLLDDLLQSFFSLMKYKMIKGNTALMSDIRHAQSIGSFKLTNLKGLRKLKYMFKKHNLKNLIEMNLNLVSTELEFLSHDFINLFEKSVRSQMGEHHRSAKDVYLKFIGYKVL